MNLYLKKLRILDECKRYVASRIQTANQAMVDAQQAANEEDKSSAGDKYETGRAMMQIERDQAAQQLDEALKLRQIVDQISLENDNEKVTLGSLVITNSKKIFIGISIGRMEVDGETYLVVSPASPLGKVLTGLKVNDEATFNKERLTILQIG